MEEDIWEIVQSICTTPGAEGVPVYGVRVRCRDGGTWHWPDVDTDPVVTSRLVKRLQETQPERCHYAELVEDYIQEMAGAPL